jgi:hypothetical protein
VPLGSSVQGATSWLAKAGVRAVQMLRRALVLKHIQLAAASAIPRPWTDLGQRQREWGSTGMCDGQPVARRCLRTVSVVGVHKETRQTRSRARFRCAVLGLVAPSVAAWTPGSQQVADEGP